MRKELNILILEDNPDDVELLKHELRRGGIEFLPKLAAARETFLRELDDCVPDIILADYKLPSFDGLTALSIAKEKCPDSPFIFVSGTLGEDTAIEALKKGATDYVLKQRLSRLVPVLNRALQEAEESRMRRRAEAALIESEERYRTLFETSPDAIVLTDLDGRIMMANKQAAALYGGTYEELMGRNVKELVVPEEELKVEEVRQAAYFAGNIKNVEHRAFRKDGSVFPAEVNMSVIRDLQETPYAIIAIIRDVSERKKLEWQLFHSQKLQAIGQLAGGVAHDFNNILTAIVGYANLSQSSLKENDPAAYNIRQILEASERAAYLTRSLLAFSRRQIINPIPVKINELISNTERFLKRIIGEDVELKTYLAEKESAVMADEGQIEQVLMNLATNARDAMPEGGILTIETDLVELDNTFIQSHGYGEAGTYVLVSVADTGIGMDESTRKNIFEPYFTTKEVGKGTGLGLAITYGIVKQHKGFINVYSEPGRGTTFRIYLPLTEVELEKAVKKEPASALGGTETILLAEDDKVVRKLIRTVLEQSGYKVIEAVDGEDAVNKFAENRDTVQLLLVDVIMPRKNGREAYEEIKRVRPDIKALFSSGYTANIIHKKGILEEGIDFISKPIFPLELLKKVREVLGPGSPE